MYIYYVYVIQRQNGQPIHTMLQHVAACCSVLQRVAACCSVLQCVIGSAQTIQRVF